jgi:hypothetical protein
MEAITRSREADGGRFDIPGRQRSAGSGGRHSSGDMGGGSGDADIRDAAETQAVAADITLVIVTQFH